MTYSSRIAKLSSSLKDCDGVMIDDPIDLYYLTGLELSLGRLFVDRAGQSTLLVDGRYLEVCKEQQEVLVELWDFKSNMPLTLPKKVGFDSSQTSYASYSQLIKEQGVEFVPLNRPVLELRKIKEPSEIKLLKEAADLCVKGFKHGCSLLNEGVTEREIAWQIEKFWRELGGEKLSFDPIVAFGENSSKPHHHVTDRQLHEGDTVLFDLGIRRHHYHSDMTRVLFFKEPDPKMKVIYQHVYEALSLALEACKPGTPIGEVDKIARDSIKKAGFELVHGLGHGVGLEVHEAPRVREKVPGAELPLQEGMVVTIEPGIYVPGLGGVRLEEEIVINSNGFEYLIDCPILQI